MRGVKVVGSCEESPDEQMGKKQVNPRADGAIQEVKKHESRVAH